MKIDDKLTFMIFRRRTSVSISVSILSMMMSPGLDISWPVSVDSLTSSSQLQFDTSVVKTDGYEKNQEDEGDNEAKSRHVIVDVAHVITVIAVVGVPAPVEDHHTQGTHHEDDDE